MSGPVLLLCLCAFALLGSLPFICFRPGRKSLHWWLTAAPFFTDAALLTGALAGVVAPLSLPAGTSTALAYAAVPLVVGAVALIGCTIGVHRVPLALWHQVDDAPAQIVTHGPYARVRHPFYLAFVLLLVAAALTLPHPGTLLMLAAGAVQLHRTARREERRLLQSAFAREYAAYMARTGRFLPRVRVADVRAGSLAGHERAGQTTVI